MTTIPMIHDDPRPRLGTAARLWLVAGALAAPLSALALVLAGWLLRAPGLRRGAGAVLTRRLMLAGPSRPVMLADGGTLPAGLLHDVALSDRMNLELDAAELDLAYVRALGPRRDLALVLRSMWAALLDRGGAPRGAETNHFNLFGVVVNNSETTLVLRTIEEMTLSHPNQLIVALGGASGPEPGRPAHVCFVNANNFNLALERPEYMEALRRADLVLPDGIGVKIALQMAGGRLRRNLNGTDLFPHLAEMFARREWPVYLLGATGPILDRARANIQRRHPGLVIAGMHDGYFKPDDELALCDAINASGAMAVLVGMGTPRQELWAERNAARLRVPLVMTLGGLLDFLGEKNRRAPLWMRQSGLEWVYRMLQEPGRMWRRYIIGNPVFLWRVRRWIRKRATETGARKGRQRP